MWVEQLPALHLDLLDLRDQTILAIADNSIYTSTPTSGNYNLVITPPQYASIAVTNFTPGAVNIYRCADLGITCSTSGCTPLPDGIYGVNYTILVSGNIATNNQVSENYVFIKVDQIKCKYQHTFLKVHSDCNCLSPEKRKFSEKVREARILIDGCVAACNEGNYIMSFNKYQQADFILDNLCNIFGRPNSSTCGTTTTYGGFCSACSN